jgi:hypothetical protein
MSVCDLTSASLQMQRATKQLQERWHEAQQSWNDAVSREFQAKYLEPILPELRLTMSAAQELSELLTRAEQFCRDPRRGGHGV